MQRERDRLLRASAHRWTSEDIVQARFAMLEPAGAPAPSVCADRAAIARAAFS
jgi:hypothetical protein